MFCFVINSFSSSGTVPKERRAPAANTTKKDQEFRSIFQHIQSAQIRRSPSELFAQHIVSIVHYIKGTAWSASGLSTFHKILKIHKKMQTDSLVKLCQLNVTVVLSDLTLSNHCEVTSLAL